MAAWTSSLAEEAPSLLYKSCMAMKLSCEVIGLGHRFQNFYLFKDLNLEIRSGSLLLVKGANGAGKSTFVKILAGGLEAMDGKVVFISESGSVLEKEVLWRMMAMVAPYLELPEELTLRELIDFQIRMDVQKLEHQPFLEVAEALKMEKHLDRFISTYSTGMKQKAKIIAAFGMERPVLFLDEPTSNLDQESQEWVLHRIADLKKSRLIVMASNEPAEMRVGDEFMEL